MFRNRMIAGTLRPPTIAAAGDGNLLTQPSAFDHADWTKNDCTVTANAITDPFSGSAADMISEIATTGIHGVGQIITKAGVSKTYNLSVYAKQGTDTGDGAGRFRITLQLDDAVANGRFVAFDLVTPQVGTSVGGFGSFSGGTASVVDLADDWVLCKFEGIVTLTETSLRTLILMDHGVTTDPGDINYTGVVTQEIYLYGASLVEVP